MNVVFVVGVIIETLGFSRRSRQFRGGRTRWDFVSFGEIATNGSEMLALGQVIGLVVGVDCEAVLQAILVDEFTGLSRGQLDPIAPGCHCFGIIVMSFAHQDVVGTQCGLGSVLFPGPIFVVRILLHVKHPKPLRFLNVRLFSVVV